MPTLHWLTRDADIHAATHVPYRLLEEAPDLSTGDPDAGNIAHPRRQSGSTQGTAAVLRRSSEVHLHRPAV